MKKGAMCRCGKPATHEGRFYRLSSKKAEKQPLCMSDFLECEFGLWPYICVKSCQAKRAAASDMAQTTSPDDYLIWISLDMIVSTRDKAMRPRCPWCTRVLKPWPPRPKSV